MSESTVKNIVNHLSILGCIVTKHEEVRIVFRDEECLFAFREESGGIMLRMYRDLTEYGLNNRNQALEFVNQLNGTTNITRFILDNESVNMLYWFTAEYDKDRFNYIYELFIHDTVDVLYDHEWAEIMLEV